MTETFTETREIEVPWWIAIPLTLLIWGGLLYGGILIGHATAPVHTVIVDQTYTGQQIAACIQRGLCPSR